MKKVTRTELCPVVYFNNEQEPKVMAGTSYAAAEKIAYMVPGYDHLEKKYVRFEMDAAKFFQDAAVAEIMSTEAYEAARNVRLNKQ